MRLTKLVTAAIGLTLLVTGCERSVDGTPDQSPGPSSPSSTSSDLVGYRKITWNESQGPAEALKQYDATHDDLLLRTPDEYEQWRVVLLAPMNIDAEGVTLTDQVAVVGSYHKCMESSGVRDLGDGKIRFDVWVPPGKKGTACAWSPLQVEVWIVGLDELKVSSADDVELVS